MNKKITIIATTFLVGGVTVGIAIAYLMSRESSERTSIPSTSKGVTSEVTPGMSAMNRSRIAALYKCQCGCLKDLNKCTCEVASDITQYLNSLIDGQSSEDAIRERMIDKYGESIVKVVETVPPYYESVEGVELPMVLGIELVSEKSKEAYGIARENPELLAQMPCYCGCDSHRAHKSLLDCFADRHGDNCRLCRNESIFAKEKMDQGMNPEEIRQAIIGKWGRKRV